MNTPESSRELSQRLYQALSEKERRLFAAYESFHRGRGGISSAHQDYGLSIRTIRKGRAELRANTIVAGRQRRRGGGRTATLKKYPELSKVFLEILDVHIAGSPQKEVLWTDRTDKELQEKLKERGYTIGLSIIKQLLSENGLGKRKHQKTKTMGEHADRNAQFERIAALKEEYAAKNAVILSMDTKKKNSSANLPVPAAAPVPHQSR